MSGVTELRTACHRTLTDAGLCHRRLIELIRGPRGAGPGAAPGPPEGELLRHMINVLGASGSCHPELTPQPDLADLERLVDASGIEAKLTTDLPDDLPPTVLCAFYRTVLDALTNVRKHAPGATATVRIHHVDGAVRSALTNTAPNRRAFALPSAHHGLVGLAQRAELLGGTVRRPMTYRGRSRGAWARPAPRGRRRRASGAPASASLARGPGTSLGGAGVGLPVSP